MAELDRKLVIEANFARIKELENELERGQTRNQKELIEILDNLGDELRVLRYLAQKGVPDEIEGLSILLNRISDNLKQIIADFRDLMNN